MIVMPRRGPDLPEGVMDRTGSKPKFPVYDSCPEALPSDFRDEAWAQVAPRLTLLPQEARYRLYSLREVFDGQRYIIKTGAPSRWMPKDAPRRAVYQSRRSGGWPPAAVRRCVGRLHGLVWRLRAGAALTPSQLPPAPRWPPVQVRCPCHTAPITGSLQLRGKQHGQPV